jgi:hypothetical protein
LSFSYDPTTPLGQVRLLCGDTTATAPGPLFQDEDLNALLTIEQGLVRYAAAQALELIAAREVLVQKHIKLSDLETDGPSQAKELRALAKALRDSEEAMGAFDFAEMVQDPFSARERIYKQFLRLRQ